MLADMIFFIEFFNGRILFVCFIYNWISVIRFLLNLQEIKFNLNPGRNKLHTRSISQSSTDSYSSREFFNYLCSLPLFPLHPSLQIL